MLPVLLALVREALVSHDERREAVGESIDARAWLHVGALVGPDNIEARIDAWYRETVEGRVAEREGREVVGVRELRGIMISLWFHGRRETPRASAPHVPGG